MGETVDVHNLRTDSGIGFMGHTIKAGGVLPNIDYDSIKPGERALADGDNPFVEFVKVTKRGGIKDKPSPKKPPENRVADLRAAQDKIDSVPPAENPARRIAVEAEKQRAKEAAEMPDGYIPGGMADPVDYVDHEAFEPASAPAATDEPKDTKAPSKKTSKGGKKAKGKSKNE